MKRTDEKYQAYVQILKEELVPAMGCTEPIALAYAAAKAREVLGCLPDRVCIEASGSIILAYAAAKAREVLGCLPDRVCIEASGSIIKNVKSVIGKYY